MRKFFSFLLFISFFYSLAKNSTEERVNLITSIMKSHPDSAISLSHRLLDDSRNTGDDYGLVQSNFILGYIHDKIQVDYGKAIIFYLEAIRFGEESNYPNAINNLISLNKNSGVIFRKFNSFDLAEEYYLKALSYANQIGDKNQTISIKYNLSSLYRDRGDISKAISVLTELESIAEIGSLKYFEILNRISYTYFENQDLHLSKIYAQKIIDSDCKDQKLIIYARNILGKIFIKNNDSDRAFDELKKAYSIAIDNSNNLEDRKAEFEILYDLGINSYQSDRKRESLAYFSSAEEVLHLVDQNPTSFEIYKHMANVYFELGNYQNSKKYEDLYSQSLTQYLKVQESLQETDKRYNIDLITKRYFDEVAKQERIAYILFYSKLISGSLLALLLFTIGFNWYQKVKLRKSLVRDLMALKMID